MDNTLSSKPAFLLHIAEVLTFDVICSHFGNDYRRLYDIFSSSYKNEDYDSSDFWIWIQYQEPWEELGVIQKQRVIYDFAKLCGVDRGDYTVLPDDRSVFDQLRSYEKSSLGSLFCNTELLHNKTIITDPFAFDSYPARRILLFVNLKYITGNVPSQITPDWKHYKSMERFARSVCNG